MPFQILHEDITRVACDAIVNPTDPAYSGGGGVDRAVHEAAGPGLRAAVAGLDPLRVGGLSVTEAFSLPCRYVFHTVGPVWAGGRNGEAAVLKGCYQKALRKAKELGLHSIAFPLISSGAFGFPRDQVLQLAMDAISAFLLDDDAELLVSVCVPDRTAYSVPDEQCLVELCHYGSRARALRREEISFPQNAACIEEDADFSLPGPMPARKPAAPAPKAAKAKRRRPAEEKADEDHISFECACALPKPAVPAEDAELPDGLQSWIERQDESFSLMLQKLIDKKGMDDVSCYKKANVSRKTYWKIVNDANYRPSKNTVIAFAIALKLNYEETQRLLRSVGFSLSESFVFDRIIEYYIDRQIYDVFEINAALYHFDQPLLGC